MTFVGFIVTTGKVIEKKYFPFSSGNFILSEWGFGANISSPFFLVVRFATSLMTCAGEELKEENYGVHFFFPVSFFVAWYVNVCS